MRPKGRMRKIVLRIGAVLGALVLLFYLFSIYYLSTRKNEVAELIIEAINERYPGDIEFGEVSVDKWVGLPAPAISFNDLTVTDTTGNYRFVLRANKAATLLSIADLLKQKIHVRSVLLSDGEITVHNYTPLSPEEQAELPPPIDSLRLSEDRQKYYFEKDTEVSLKNFDVTLRHHTKNKLFDFHVNEVSAVLNFNDNLIAAETEMDVVVNTLGFDMSKGSYINGAKVSGAFSSVFDLDKDRWQLSPFLMQLNDQVYNFQADFSFQGWGSFDIAFENTRTDFKSAINLLTERLRNRLTKYQFSQPLHTNGRITGNFVYRANPLIIIDFKTQNNSVVINERLPMDVQELSGTVINRIYDDERADSEDRRNIRVKFDDIEASINDMKIQITDPLFTGTPEEKNYWKGKILARGPMESLNEFMEGQLLSFQDGDFEITADVDGNIENLEDFVVHSAGQFEMNSSRITNKGNKVSVPIDQMQLSLENNKARLDRLDIRLNASDRLQVYGEVENFSELFSKSSEKSLNSHFDIRSGNLVWKDFLRLFDITKTAAGNTRPEFVLQDVLKDLYKNYNPSFTVRIAQFQLGEVQMQNFRTGIRYENENLIRLDQTSFDVEGGDIRINANIALNRKDVIWMYADLNGISDTEVLNDVLGVDELDFIGGKLHVDARIQGNMLQMDRILRSSKLNLKIEDAEVAYIPMDVVLPFKMIDLTLEGDNAIVKDITMAVGKEDQVTFSGIIENLPTLLFKKADKKVRSEFNITSEKLVLEDYLELFDQQKSANKGKDQGGLKKLLRDIHNSVDPRVNVRIGELYYAGMPPFLDFTSEIFFKDEQTLVFGETTFTYKDGTTVSLEALLDAKNESQTGLHMDLTAAGNPEQLNPVLNNDIFIFESGEFEAKATIEGNMSDLDSLIATSESTLKIRDGIIVHKPSQSRIPYSNLEIEMADNSAQLKEFTIVLRSGDKITFTGRVEHISDLIFDVPAVESKASSYVKAFSEKLTFDDILELFESRQVISMGNQEPRGSDNAIKPAIRDVYNKFKPRLSASVREFQLDDLVLHDLRTGFFFENENMLYLEDTGFTFYDGKVNLDAHLDITDPHSTLFAFGFSTEELELDKVLESFDYFNIDAFREAENISGKVSMNTEIEGDIIDSTGVVSNSLKGSIDFKLEDAQVAGFEPIIKVANKIFKKERFQDIRFGPIENTFYLSDNKVDIPQMEIQSTAFNIFISGQYGFGEVDTNIWTSIPLENLKKRDLINIPDKKGYVEAGKMVYIEAKSDKNDEIKYVLHLSPRKYYKERGILSQYREEIKEERKLRREFKRASRNSDSEDSDDKSD